MDYVARKNRALETGRLMARATHVYTLSAVAELLGENIELLEEISCNSDNIDDGEMIRIYDGSEDGVIGFTDRGVDCIRELLADARTWEGGIRKLLIAEHCDPEVIERIMLVEGNR